MHGTSSQGQSRGLSPTIVASRLVDNVGIVLHGKRDVAQLAVTTLLADGHLLLEDVPGVGKTTLARALAASVGLDFQRVQFTSDLMPADVLGGNVYTQATGEFTFRPGPIFTHVLLADEINRTTPKTQSALLEAMDERRVSLDRQTHVLETPFIVLATQNPEEFFGTHPLPESQLDRFLMRLRIGYPPEDVERQLIVERRRRDPVADLSAVVSRDELLQAQAAVDEVRTDDAVIDYLYSIVLATRNSPLIAIGASTRAALALDRATRAFAVVSGRTYATPDDVKAVAVAVLGHRIRPAAADDGRASSSDGERIVRELLASVAVPV